MLSNNLKEKFSLIKERTLRHIMVDDITSNIRYNTCRDCQEFNNLTKTCRECGCFMPAKVKLKEVVCPLKKW